MSKQRRCHTPE